MNLSDSLVDSPDGYNTDPFVMTHYELTGEVVPEAVLKRFFTFDEDRETGAEAFTAPTLKALDAEVREINLAHQAAQAATRAPLITKKLLHLHRQCVQAAHAMVLRCGLVSLVVSTDQSGEYIIKEKDEGSVLWATSSCLVPLLTE